MRENQIVSEIRITILISNNGAINLSSKMFRGLKYFLFYNGFPQRFRHKKKIVFYSTGINAIELIFKNIPVLCSAQRVSRKLSFLVCN